MTPAVQSALAGLPAAFTPSTTAVGGNVYLTAAVGLLPLVVFFILNSARLVPRPARRR